MVEEWASLRLRAICNSQVRVWSLGGKQNNQPTVFGTMASTGLKESQISHMDSGLVHTTLTGRVGITWVSAPYPAPFWRLYRPPVQGVGRGVTGA